MEGITPIPMVWLRFGGARSDLARKISAHGSANGLRNGGGSRSPTPRPPIPKGVRRVGSASCRWQSGSVTDVALQHVCRRLPAMNWPPRHHLRKCRQNSSAASRPARIHPRAVVASRMGSANVQWGHRRSDVRFGAHRRLKSDMTRGPIKCRYRKSKQQAHQLENGPPKGERQKEKGRRSRRRA